MFGVKEARVVEAAPFMAALSTLHGIAIYCLDFPCYLNIFSGAPTETELNERDRYHYFF